VIPPPIQVLIPHIHGVRMWYGRARGHGHGRLLLLPVRGLEAELTGEEEDEGGDVCEGGELDGSVSDSRASLDVMKSTTY
jgi:hypothetical protein